MSKSWGRFRCSDPTCRKSLNGGDNVCMNCGAEIPPFVALAMLNKKRIIASVLDGSQGDAYEAIANEWNRRFPKAPVNQHGLLFYLDGLSQTEVLEAIYGTVWLDVVEQDENTFVDVNGGSATVSLPRGGYIEFEYFPEYGRECPVTETRRPSRMWDPRLLPTLIRNLRWRR